MSHLPHPFIEGQPHYDPDELRKVKPLSPLMQAENLAYRWQREAWEAVVKSGVFEIEGPKEGIEAMRKAGLLVIDDAPMPGTEAWERLMEYQRQLEAKRIAALNEP